MNGLAARSLIAETAIIHLVPQVGIFLPGGDSVHHSRRARMDPQVIGKVRPHPGEAAPDGYLVESRRDLGEHAIDDAFLVEHVDDEAYEAAEAVNHSQGDGCVGP